MPLPVFDGRIVVFEGSQFRLLVAPAQPAQEFANMIVMVLKPQSSLDQDSDP